MGGGEVVRASRVGRFRVRSGDARRRYVDEHFFLFLTGAAAAIAGPVLLLLPVLLDSSALGITLTPLVERLWALVYGAAGWLVVLGMLRPDARLEFSGLVLLAAAYICEMYAAVAARGTGGLIVCALLVGPTIGACVRAYVLRFEPENQPWRQRSTPS